MKKALRCWTQGFLHPLLHLVKGGVAVEGTVLLHADAAELVGKGKVLAKTGPAQLFQLVPRYAVTFQLPQKGADEAIARTAHGFAPCRKVRAVDTTGAGDGFIGSFLWQLSRDGVTVDKLEKLSCKKLEEYLDFSNRFCGRSVQKHGAIDSYPTLPEMGL